MGPEIYSVELIGNGVLAVMAKPVSGEWIDDEFNGISIAGFNQIVSLLESHEGIEVGLKDEQFYAEKYAMDFVSYPIRDRGLPLSAKGFYEFTQEIYHQISGGINTVVHCRAGIGRTGLVAAGILLHAGYGPSEAFELVSLKRGVNVPDTQAQINWLVDVFHEYFTAGMNR